MGAKEKKKEEEDAEENIGKKRNDNSRGCCCVPLESFCCCISLSAGVQVTIIIFNMNQADNNYFFKALLRRLFVPARCLGRCGLGSAGAAVGGGGGGGGGGAGAHCEWGRVAAGNHGRQR